MTSDARKQFQTKQDAIEAGKGKPGRMLRVVTTPEDKERAEPKPVPNRRKEV